MAYITRCVTARGGTRIEFAYDTHRPFHVSMTFFDRGEAKPWVCARDVLAEREPGLGDVAVESAGEWTVIRLSSPDGEASVVIPRRQVAEFLRQTARAVPHGSEVIEFDAELQELLQGGAR